MGIHTRVVGKPTPSLQEILKKISLLSEEKVYLKFDSLTKERNNKKREGRLRSTTVTFLRS